MSEEVDSQSRMWATFCHLSALSVYIGIPLGNIAGPLIIWLIKKDEYPFVNIHGKEALNFQISITIYVAIAIVLVIFLIGIPILIALGIASLVLVIIASIKANRGEQYRYPITIRFIS